MTYTRPKEVVIPAGRTVDRRGVTLIVPPPTGRNIGSIIIEAIPKRTRPPIRSAVTSTPRTVVAVVRRELHTVVVGERIVGRSAVSGHIQQVPSRLVSDDKRTIVDPVPVRVRRVHVDVDLVAAVLRQQVEAVVAEPEVVSIVAEARFECGPGVVESLAGAATSLHHDRRAI